MFIRNRLYAPVEDGNDGGGGDGGAPPDETGLVPADQPDAGGGGGAGAAPEDAPEGEPKPSMLDAIKASLGGGDGATAKPAEAGAPPAKPAAEKAPVKDDKYAVPGDLSPKGQERFKELVNEIKTKSEEVTHLTERVKSAEEFLEVAKGVGAGPQEFQQFFDFMGQLRGGKPEQAIRFLENQISLIAKEFGLAAGGNEDDLLAKYPDLKEEAETYRITKERALELAQAREQRQRGEVVQTQTRQQQEQEAKAKQVHEAAVKSVADWAAQVSKTDIDWLRKKDVLFSQLAQLVDGVSPDKWLTKIEAAYKLMGPMKAPPADPTKIRQATPLRASTGSGVPQAGSMQEAIKRGLEQMAGGR